MFLSKMWNKFKSYGKAALASGLLFFGFSGSAQAVTNDAEAVNTALTTLSANAGSLFDAVVPIVLAVVGLGVLISMIKLIKKR